MKKYYKPNPGLYRTYYTNQAKGQYGGTLPAFHGIQRQRGYGIGSFLKGLFRSAVPVLKAGAKSIGKTALASGMNLAQDYMDGKELKSASRSRALEAANSLTSQAVNRARSLINQKGKGIKRRASSKAVSSSRAKKKKTSTKKARQSSSRKKKSSRKVRQSNSSKKKGVSYKKTKARKKKKALRDIFGN